MLEIFGFRYRTHDRGFSTDHQPPHKPEITPPGKLKSYIVKKYIGYVEGFELKVEKHYPRVYKVYKLFKEGNTSTVWNLVKIKYFIKAILNSDGFVLIMVEFRNVTLIHMFYI